ncbi:metallophosphoesterase family protein [Halovivax sp.]|uniref:metallophosphoesterase family protein n=1 Tax=Halovivax sp. TaxID=1935978 RepID=UPI0025C71230|nr:metallophosphoesterase family protein [Halovivax sp.]
MTHIAILADTHVPSRANGLPDWVADELHAADRAIHAGDVDSPDAYETVADLVGGESALTAVGGNLDPAELELPTVATLSVEGVTFAVTHGSGSPRGHRERALSTIREMVDLESREEPIVAVAGHTHAVVDERVDEIRFLNPGSATGASPADRETMLRATVADGAVEVERLPE